MHARIWGLNGGSGCVSARVAALFSEKRDARPLTRHLNPVFILPNLSIRIIDDHGGFLASDEGSKEGLLHAVQAAALI